MALEIQFLHLCHGDVLLWGYFGIKEAFGENGRNEVLHLISQSLTVVRIEKFLIQVLVLKSNLKVIGLPPWSCHIGISLCTGNHHVAFRLYAKSHLE